ncbi:MAG: 1-deoxy-D-xylulose-5-phosphate synthase [Massilibacteroides sp.]|nr:1-deoxy-D-xylulose-5-phosphate synthase [Massilibacteroides sp.]
MSIYKVGRLLQNIEYPKDLQALPQKELAPLCEELRQYIIEVLSHNPGHLGASLGTVELTVALHYVFHTPYDRIVWDVGHQAYSHKILTGRKEAFKTLRQLDGISGFPNPKESEYDAFIAGHASNSISAALGMAVASKLKKEDRQIVAVIGDGAMTGGLSFEALNNASANPNNLLIILNDNHMAIDNNVGGLNQYLVNINTSQAYNKLRYEVYRGLRKLNIIDDKRRDNIIRFNNSLKALLTQQHNLFEGFSIRYFGPIDGHDVTGLISKLNDIKDMKGPKLLHIRTTKGKGYKPAEESATIWHAPGCFDKETGIRIKKSDSKSAKYQDVFGLTLVELAKMDKRIVAITPAMPTGCSMTYMQEAFPDRTFDVGIAEAHAVTFSAGLAKEGLLPFCNLYSTFMQRAYDQIIHDVAMQNLHLTLCLDRAGLVGEDGMTHHGVFDMSALRPIPGLTIASPLNELELRNLMYTSVFCQEGTFVIRYPRGNGVLDKWQKPFESIPIGKGRKLKDGNDVAVLSIGPIGNDVAQAIKEIGDTLSVAHYDMRFLKPLDESILHEVGKKYKRIITVEDSCRIGGFGSAILEFMADHHYTTSVTRIGLEDNFVTHGPIKKLNERCGLDVNNIKQIILK